MVIDGCAQRAFSGGQASTSRMRGRAALHSYHGHSRRSWRCRAGSKDADDASGDGRGVSEDVLAKLRAFEEENRKLKDRLKEKQPANAEASQASPQPPEARRPGRIDGTGLSRETLFGGSKKQGSWLSENDIDFFTGGKPGEVVTDKLKMTTDEQSVVTKRLLLAGVGVAAISAFALIPTTTFNGTASKPVFYYLVPVIRSVDLLDDEAKEIEGGEFSSVPVVVRSILKKPNEARKNMYTAIDYLEGSKQQPARELVGNFVDLVQQADYQKYYDSKGPKNGTLMAQYQDFSLRSVRAAAREARAFLALFPSRDVRAARDMLAVPAES